MRNITRSKVCLVLGFISSEGSCKLMYIMLIRLLVQSCTDWLYMGKNDTAETQIFPDTGKQEVIKEIGGSSLLEIKRFS